MKQFKLNLYYKSKCVIFTPSGTIKKGSIYLGKEWIKLLSYGVGDSFNKMFGIVKEKKIGG